MASLLVLPRMQTMLSLIVMVPELLLDLGNVCIIRKGIAVVQSVAASSHRDFYPGVINPHTSEGFKVMCNAFQGGWQWGNE